MGGALVGFSEFRNLKLIWIPDRKGGNGRRMVAYNFSENLTRRRLLFIPHGLH